MSEWKATTLPCPCGKSSDAYSINTRDWGTCFSCGKSFPPKDKKGGEPVQDNHNAVQVDQRRGRNTRQINPDDYKYQYLEYRGVKPDTWKFFGYPTAISKDTGDPSHICFPVPNGRTLNKRLDRKEFFYTGEKLGEHGNLFGMDKFAPGSSKAITICEGALDMASVFQMFGKKYATVAVTSATSAKSECAKEYEYLNSFERIYLCFDNDQAGKEAASQVARLFDFNKVYVVQLVRKDANDILKQMQDLSSRKLGGQPDGSSQRESCLLTLILIGLSMTMF